MGRVRTKTVKRASRVLIEKGYHMLTTDFELNKRVASDIASIPSKRLRNKIAGFATHLMKRIQKGPVRGISFKLQEEERERKDNYVPEVSALAHEEIFVDPVTAEMLKKLDVKISNLKVGSGNTNQDSRGVVGANFRRRPGTNPRQGNFQRTGNAQGGQRQGNGPRTNAGAPGGAPRAPRPPRA